MSRRAGASSSWKRQRNGLSLQEGAGGGAGGGAQTHVRVLIPQDLTIPMNLLPEVSPSALLGSGRRGVSDAWSPKLLETDSGANLS